MTACWRSEEGEKNEETSNMCMDFDSMYGAECCCADARDNSIGSGKCRRSGHCGTAGIALDSCAGEDDRAGEEADTEGVIPIVVSEYETRMANAENLVARVEAGDTSVTQDMIDESWKSLMEILQYLEFKQGDKRDLESAIEFAEGLDMN